MAFADIGKLETLHCSFRDGVATIALDRQEKLNAICGEMHRDLRTAFDALEADSTVRCLLLTGHGRAFCSGQDLMEDLSPAGDGRPDLGSALDRDYNPLIRRIDALGIPTVAAVNGIAAGAGANLALMCDIVLMAESASLVEAFCRIALVPDVGGTWILPRLVGRQRALAMMMTGEPVDAQTAREWGLAWKVLPDESFADGAQAFAAGLAKGPTATYAMMKDAVRKSWDNSLPAQLDVERDVQTACGKLDDFMEGITAFAQKRQPVFKGK